MRIPFPIQILQQKLGQAFLRACRYHGLPLRFDDRRINRRERTARYQLRACRK